MSPSPLPPNIIDKVYSIFYSNFDTTHTTDTILALGKPVLLPKGEVKIKTVHSQVKINVQLISGDFSL